MPVKEKLVKILAPGVGIDLEMAAQNRRRNDTSRHAVGVWEEFSFLDKGTHESGWEKKRESGRDLIVWKRMVGNGCSFQFFFF